jgi:hypothetical protein
LSACLLTGSEKLADQDRDIRFARGCVTWQAHQSVSRATGQS